MRNWFTYALLASVLLFATGCVSCALDPEIVDMWGGDSEPPVFLGAHPVSSTLFSVQFSESVKVERAQLIFNESVIPVLWTYGDGDRSVDFTSDIPMGAGTEFILSSAVSDSRGNTLSFAVPLTGFNDRPARLRINEIRFDYSKPKVEYIEFYVLEDGNLAGVEIFNAMNETKPTYAFPFVDVQAGEYVVWHLRSIEEGLIDEIDDVAASAGIDARPFARDFWDTQTKAPLKKTNVILLRERSGGPLMDAFICAETSKVEWPTETVRLAAEEAFREGFWKKGPLITDAIVSTGTTTTRTLGYTESGGLPGWVISPTSKCSPGAANYQP